ncbi:MAG: LacI family DNA-binding transcriptional regulator [Rhizobiales bacterium]|nr:LacI family DNA-binding transcriptional regulator [Hyphomicrobiales bacterium]MBI3671946.1 LacI family DNA-binding transcriptional regulator [Hyphomicrobiales bacterium]
MAAARPTIYDVAQRARVSPATVSKVLRGVTTVSPANAERVNEAVQELSYRRDALAANLRRNRRAIVGLIVPDFRNPFFGALVAEIERLAEEQGFRLVAVSSSESAEKEAAQIEALLDWRVGGLIVIPATGQLASAARLRQEAMPLVILDRVPDRIPFDGVGVDNAEACAAMVRHFHDLGHRRLLVAASLPRLPNMAERLRGVAEAAEALAQPMDIETLFCGAGLDSASRTMARRFAEAPLPTAVFTLYIQGTLAVLRAIGAHDLAIPGEISIAGFDDFEWMQVMHPPVATVIQPVAKLARAAWEQLHLRIDHPLEPLVRRRLSCRVEFRGSIAAPRPAHR